MNIFVYGSLMRGESNHHVLDAEYTKFISTGITKRGYTLYDLGGFPGMIEGGNGAVVGEIYEVCPFVKSRLDMLEGHPQFYRRSIIELQSGDRVEAYILQPGWIKGHPIIKSGSWQNR